MIARMILFLAAFSLAGDVNAQTLVDACKSASAHWVINDEIAVTRVDDFSDLSPPRVRMRLDDWMSTVVSCTFESSQPPFTLTEYCHDFICQQAGDQRFAEIAEMLRREGY